MRIRMICAALAAAALTAAGCGSDDDSTTAASDAPETIAEIEVETGPFDTDDDFIAAVNDYCGEAGLVFDRYPMYGVGAEGLAAEFENLVALETDDVAKSESIEATDDLAADWQGYNDANSDLLATHEDVLAAAKSGDADKANEILFGPATKAVDATTKASEDLGVECAGADNPLSEAEPAGAADAAADAPQPSNSIEDAADEWLAALQSGDCKEIVAATHSQNYPTEESVADPLTGDCKSAKTNSASYEVAGTAQFGPVGMVAYKNAPGSYQYDEFVLDTEAGDALKHTGTDYAAENGLDPAPEDSTADTEIAAFVDAIRANDPDALNETLTVDTLPPGEGGFAQDGPFTALGNDPTYAKKIVSDIRADEEAEAVQIGANQIWSTYLLDTSGDTDYLLIAEHQPGSANEYGVSAFWAIPSA